LVGQLQYGYDMNSLSRMSQLYGYFMAVAIFLLGLAALYWGLGASSFMEQVITWVIGVASLSAATFIYLLLREAAAKDAEDAELAKKMLMWFPPEVYGELSDSSPDDSQDALAVPAQSVFTQVLGLFFPRTRSA